MDLLKTEPCESVCQGFKLFLSHRTVEVMYLTKIKHSKLKKETLKTIPEPYQDHYQNTFPQTGTVAGVAKHLDYIMIYHIMKYHIMIYHIMVYHIMIYHVAI